MKNLFTLLLLFIVSSYLYSQDIENSLHGRIFDLISLEKLPFANIQIVDSKIGTTSDENGNFILEGLNSDVDILISYVGYKSLKINVKQLNFDKIEFIFLSPISIGLQEITVYSNSALNSTEIQASLLSVESERIAEISSTMPDILRSVQSFPGISTNNAFKADYNVRGGNQDENLIIVNGIRVYEPFHIKEAPNASVGIFNVDLMNKVDIITGGFSAKYGDKMSSVLNIDYREGSREFYSGAASLSLAYFDGFIEGPLSKNGSFIFGVRKSYMEYLLNLIDDEEISSVEPSFYDLQGILTYDLTKRSKLFLHFIHAGDDFSYKPERNYSNKIENESNLASYTSSLVGLRNQNILSSEAVLSAEINYYSQGDNEYRLFEREYTNYERFVERLTYDTLQIKTLELKSDLQYQFSQNYYLDVGISYSDISFERNSDDFWSIDDTINFQGDYGSDAVNAKSFKYSVYAENIFNINSFTFNLGSRIDYFDLNKSLDFSPRINASYEFSGNSRLKAAWGYYYQSPIYDQILYSESSDTNTQSQLAIHYILGLEHIIKFSNNNDYLNLRLEGFYKKYDDLISSSYGVFERLTYSKVNDAAGDAAGLDLYASLNLGGFYSWLSYGLLFANEDLKGDSEGKYPRYTDQRHTISLVTGFDLGKDYKMGIKAYYGSGYPYTPREAFQNEQGIWQWKSGKSNSAKLPDYKRVDLRISKSLEFSAFDLLTFIDISNVFNFKNIQRYEYKSEPDINRPVREEILLWPIIPSFGVRLSF